MFVRLRVRVRALAALPAHCVAECGETPCSSRAAILTHTGRCVGCFLCVLTAVNTLSRRCLQPRYRPEHEPAPTTWSAPNNNVLYTAPLQVYTLTKIALGYDVMPDGDAPQQAASSGDAPQAVEAEVLEADPWGKKK